MKQILLIILSAFLTTCTLMAQDFWEQLPVPDSIHYMKETALNSNGDIFIGTWESDIPGGVFRSSDTGKTWVRVLTLEVNSVLSLGITTDDVIFAGTNSIESLYKSIDNGNSWSPVNIPLSGYLLPQIAIYGNDTIFLSEVITGGGALTMSVDGGETWNVIYTGVNHTSEAINDIVKTPNGNIYIGLEGYLQNQGGVYRTVNNGQSWEYVGLLNHMIEALALNSKGDLFAGSWGGGDGSNSGVFVLRAGKQTWDTLLSGCQITDIVINAEDHIYCGSGWPMGVIYSLDDGNTFYMKNQGLRGGQVSELEIDINGYIYALDGYCNRTVNTTINNKSLNVVSNSYIKIVPNPIVDNIVNVLLPTHKNGEFKILIYNQIGQIIISKNVFLAGNTFSINIGKIESGLYNIIIMNNKQQYTVQFIKP